MKTDRCANPRPGGADRRQPLRPPAPRHGAAAAAGDRRGRGVADHESEPSQILGF